MSKGYSNNQMRNLSYTARTPAFLKNTVTALQGPTVDSKRPEERSDTEETPLGFLEGDADDEAPTVVVLNEKRHLSLEEAKGEVGKDTGEEDEKDDVQEKEEARQTLTFSTKSKKRAHESDEAWKSLVKTAKGDQVDQRQSADKTHKMSKKKKKALQEKQKARLSFVDDE